MSEEEYMTVEELAAFLKLSKSRIFQMIKSEDLPYIKLGGVYRFSKNKIIKMMDDKIETAKDTRPSLKGKNPREVRV